MTLKELLANHYYKKSWAELTAKEKGRLVLEHPSQFQWLKEKKMETDRELLLEMKRDLSWIKDNLQGHLEHHFRFYLLAGGTLISSIIAIALAVLS